MGNRITEIAQNLRKNPTHAENLLWKYLRNYPPLEKRKIYYPPFRKGG